MLAQGVHDCRIYLQRHILGQTVIDDGGDGRALLVVRSLGLYHRGDDDSLVQRDAEVVRLRVHIRRQLAVEVQQELVDGARRLHALIELVGVREEVALQAARFARLRPVEEGIIVDVVRRGLLEVLDGADALLFQLLKYLLHGIAFGEGYGRRHHGDGRRLHPEHQGVVVALGIELIGAWVHVDIRVGEPAEKLEKALVFDEARVLERVRNVVEVRAHDGLLRYAAVLVLDLYLLLGEDALRERYGAFGIFFIERQHVRGRHPAYTGQDDAQADDKDEVHEPAKAAGLTVASRADGHEVPLLQGLVLKVLLRLLVLSALLTLVLVFRVVINEVVNELQGISGGLFLRLGLLLLFGLLITGLLRLLLLGALAAEKPALRLDGGQDLGLVVCVAVLLPALLRRRAGGWGFRLRGRVGLLLRLRFAYAEYLIELVKIILHFPRFSQVTCLPRRAYYGSDGANRRRHRPEQEDSSPRPPPARGRARVNHIARRKVD